MQTAKARLTGLARAGKELVPQREQTKKKLKQQKQAEGQRATLASRAPQGTQAIDQFAWFGGELKLLPHHYAVTHHPPAVWPWPAPSPPL